MTVERKPVHNIKPGDVFDTHFEMNCVALSSPDKQGNFLGLDSDGVTVQFSLDMVKWDTVNS